jgi:hypothetical protein
VPREKISGGRATFPGTHVIKRSVATTDTYKPAGGVAESRDFDEFVRQRSRPLLRTAWLLTGGDWALAEDLAQTAISLVWGHWDRVSVMEAPEAYAHKVMEHVPQLAPSTVDVRDLHRTVRCFTSDHRRIHQSGHA